MQLNYLPIPESYSERIRECRLDDFGHTVETHIAGETGFGPCRSCLKQFNPGEKRLLFSYAPVGSNNPYNEVGPIYIHENCLPYSNHNDFPMEVKKGRLPISILLRCYSSEKRVISARIVTDNNDVENLLEELFSNSRVEFIHLRNAIDQCFIAEVRKDQGTGS